MATFKALYGSSLLLFIFPPLFLAEKLCLIASVAGLLFHKNTIEYFDSKENISFLPKTQHHSSSLETTSDAPKTDIKEDNYRSIWKYSGAPWTIVILFLNYAVVFGYSIFLMLNRITYSISLIIPFTLSIGLICGKSWANKLLLTFTPADILLHLTSILCYLFGSFDLQIMIYYELQFPLHIFCLIVKILIMVILLLKKTDIDFYTTNHLHYISQKEILIGKTIVISISLYILAGLILNISTDFSLLRYTLQIGMLILLIRGFSWVRYFYVVSCTISVIRSVVSLIDITYIAPKSAKMITPLFLIDMAVCVLIIIAMLKSKNLKEYIYKKRYG